MALAKWLVNGWVGALCLNVCVCVRYSFSCQWAEFQQLYDDKLLFLGASDS